MLTENHKRGDSIALTEGLLIAARRLSGDGLALSVTFGDTSPIGRGFRPRAGGMCSFVFLFVEKYAILVLRPCPPTLFGREVLPNGVYFHIYPVRRSECSVLLHLQVA